MLDTLQVCDYHTAEMWWTNLKNVIINDEHEAKWGSKHDKECYIWLLWNIDRKGKYKGNSEIKPDYIFNSLTDIKIIED